nr:MAG TPA: DNA-directed RNA polymerase [Caudoviricetes sp.]
MMLTEKECRDALDYLYAPLANTMVLEMSYNLLINLIDEHFKLKENTLDFKHFNLYSDSVLKNMNKDKLIEYIHMLYHNWSVADERSKNIKKYTDILHEKEVPKKPVYKKDYVGESNYFCSRCDSLMPFTLNRTAQIKYPFCPYCGQKLDWSDEE